MEMERKVMLFFKSKFGHGDRDMRKQHAVQTRALDWWVRNSVMKDHRWPKEMDKWDAEGTDWGWIYSPVGSPIPLILSKILTDHGFKWTPQPWAMGYTFYVKHQIPMQFADAVFDGEQECCVCQNEMSRNHGAVQLPCEHAFHSECIANWLTLRGTCPLCRRDPVIAHVESLKARKGEGNAFYKDGNYRDAKEIYIACLAALRSLVADRQLEFDLQNNISQAHLKLEEWTLAVNSAESALEVPGIIDSRRAKAQWRKNQALQKLQAEDVKARMVLQNNKIHPHVTPSA